MSRDQDGSLDSLLEYLRAVRAFDFTGYKRPSLARRIEKRLDAVGVSSYADYQDYLEVHPEEFAYLFNTILINVTAFFRDPAAWEYLAQNVLPGIIERKQGPIRMWCCACASGEEAYTLTILMAEAMGKNAFRDRVKIYATDVDEEALAQARTGVFAPKSVEAVPDRLRDKYFEPISGGYAFKADLRRQIIFGRLDLVQDAPISRLDLVVCRNALMYFQAETQQQVLSRIHFALGEGGVLFLGRAEMLISAQSLFAPLELKHRIFVKAHAPDDGRRLPAPMGLAAGRFSTVSRGTLPELALESSSEPRFIVDETGILVFVNRAAGEVLGLQRSDVGQPLQDLEISYRPVELRSHIDRVRSTRAPARLQQIEIPDPGPGPTFMDVLIVPLVDSGGTISGTSVSFVDVSATRTMQLDLERSKEDLETAYEELQSTNEELETTNEELQSTVEELETTNEELQSTNEELETMNEELQSTNEELRTINDELRVRTEEVFDANTSMEVILSSLRAGVVLLDAGLIVRRWSSGAEDMWGLRSEEVIGRPLRHIDFGLPVEPLIGLIEACLNDGSSAEDVVVEALNRRGRTIQCRVRCSPVTIQDRAGVMLVMEDGAD